MGQGESITQDFEDFSGAKPEGWRKEQEHPHPRVLPARCRDSLDLLLISNSGCSLSAKAWGIIVAKRKKDLPQCLFYGMMERILCCRR